jgi:hypothetical protein
MHHKASSFLLVALVSSLAVSVARSQCTYDQTFAGKVFYRVGTNDSATSNDVNAFWSFETQHDSAETRYLITEFKRNSTRLLLAKWCNGTVFGSWDNATLRDSSTTKVFAVSTGDTISFYREFTWKPSTGQRSEGTYYSPDTLDFAIELIKKSTNTRFALLDSIGVLRRVTRGYPTFYGTNPRLARVTYVVPSALNGDSVYIRVRPTQRGDGPYNFRRVDDWGMRLSGRLNDTAWQSYAQGLYKRSKGEFEDAEANPSVQLGVMPNPARGEFRAVIRGTVAGPVSLAVYDLSGKMLQVPFSAEASVDQSVPVEIREPGVYYLAVIRGGKVAAATRITIIE